MPTFRASHTARPGKRLMRAVDRIVYRVSQFVAHLNPRSEFVDHELARLLTPEQFALVRRLPRSDRAHLLSVRRRLEARSSDPDLLLAALLHDVGKVDRRGRVYLVHRVAVVLLGHWWPHHLDRLAMPSRRTWRHGFYLAREHPRLGADLARSASCNERVCWLIARHADRAVVDAELRMLQEADGEG